MQIEVSELTKNFGDSQVLKKLNFQIDKGEVVGFLGPNGAGKTTTMRILTGFLAPTSGEVKIGGENILAHPVNARKKIGYLPENNPLYPDLRVYEYFQYVASAKNIENIEDSIKKIARMCGLSERIHQTIGELSKGYRQRVGLASALLGNPDILILDEPTSGLDPNQIIEIRNLIKEIGTTKTIILSTHNLNEVDTTCNRALIIHKGNIVASGTIKDLSEKAKGKSQVKTVIAGPTLEIQQKLSALPGIDNVVSQNSNQEESAFLMDTLSNIDVRKTIFNLCVHSGWTLLELERKQMSIEDVFAELTQGRSTETDTLKNIKTQKQNN